MKNFSDYTEKSPDLLVEIGFVNDKLVFDYDKNILKLLKKSDNSDKLMKHQKFKPYEKISETISEHNVVSIYSVGKYKNDVLKIIKNPENIIASKEDYRQFINRTAMSINYKVALPNDIKIVIIPRNTSVILNDIIENLSLRNPNITYMYNTFDIVPEIEINKTLPEINNKIIDIIKKEIEISKEKGYFAMKKIKKLNLQKFIRNFSSLIPNFSLKNSLPNNNTMLLDDAILSYATTANMISCLEMYSPENLIPVTFFCHR